MRVGRVMVKMVGHRSRNSLTQTLLQFGGMLFERTGVFFQRFDVRHGVHVDSLMGSGEAFWYLISCRHVVLRWGLMDGGRKK
jgi:hypothetical protein